MRKIIATDHLSVCKDMYRQEKRVAESLAKHVASLIGIINKHPQDWRVVYEAAHVREGRAAADAALGEK